METEIFRLNLVSPLYYVSVAELDPFDRKKGDGRESGKETLFCFKLNETQSKSFEPETELFLEELIFGGEAVSEKVPGTIPQGNYLFAQKRKILSREEIISLAAEIQQEGLWQRLKLGNLLYLRFLFEDGGEVTQLLRPYTGP